jgi:sugar lactone lactonase YvrE
MPERIGSLQVSRQDHDQLGEGPVWDDRANELLRVDISKGLIHRWDPSTDKESFIKLPGEVSAAVPRAGGGVVAAVEHQLLLLDANGDRALLAEMETGMAGNRLNDCRCDARGRLWAGTMSKDRHRGEAALYRVDPDGSTAKVLDGTTISNGIGWSGSDELMYFIDSATQRIDVFDYELGSGTVAGRRTFVEIPLSAGLPDGLTVDAEDCVWVALFGGAAVRRYTPRGVLDAVIELPTSNITCPAFGGPDLGTLYITSARHRLSDADLVAQPLAGALFEATPGVSGRPTQAFAG